MKATALFKVGVLTAMLPIAAAADVDCAPPKPDLAFIGCVMDNTCDWRNRYPEQAAEMDRRQVIVRANLLERLSEASDCISYEMLMARTDAARSECYLAQLEYGSVLFGMINDGTVSASDSQNLPASQFALAQFGPCT